MALSISSLVALLLFYALTLATGIWASRKTRQKEHQKPSEIAIVGGRNMNFHTGLFTATATWVGGAYINGTAEIVYLPSRGLAWVQAPAGFALSLLGLFFVNPMRMRNHVTLMDPVQEIYGSVMGCLLFIPPLIADVFWVAAILASLDWNQTEYSLPTPNERNGSALVLPLVLQHLCPTYISIGGLGAIAAAVMSSGDSALLLAGSMFAHNIYRRIIQKKATEKDVLWAMRVSMVVFGTISAVLAFYSHSIYDLWFLGGELVYTVLFPWLCCALFLPSTNTYGSVVGFFLRFLLQLLAGEPSLKIPPVICYPGCSMVEGVYIQLFPFKIVVGPMRSRVQARSTW